MKKLLVVIMALGLFGAMPAFADHAKTTSEHQGMLMDTKEGMRECALQAESIQQKIKRIQGEIEKGSKKYSAEELKTLETKLKEANDTLDNLGKR
jgi:predicted transcriptional regulator